MFKMSVDITFVRFTFLTLMLNDFLIGESFRLYLIVVLFFQLMHMCISMGTIQIKDYLLCLVLKSLSKIKVHLYFFF